MTKPESLKVQETESKFIELINKSELSTFCIKVILQNIFKEIDIIEKNEIEEYKKSLNSEANKKGE